MEVETAEDAYKRFRSAYATGSDVQLPTHRTVRNLAPVVAPILIGGVLGTIVGAAVFTSTLFGGIWGGIASICGILAAFVMGSHQ